jgi:integrase
MNPLATVARFHKALRLASYYWHGPLVLRGKVYHVRFQFEGREIKFTTKTGDRKLAEDIEQRRRQELIESLHGIPIHTKDRTQPVRDALAEYFTRYKLAKVDRSAGSLKAVHHRINRLNEFFRNRMVGQLTVKDVTDYQAHRRQKMGMAVATINQEVGILLRGIGKRGRQLREAMKDEGVKTRLDGKPTVEGIPFSVEEQDLLLRLAEDSGSPFLPFALRIAFNTGMRHREISGIAIAQIDFALRVINIEDAKTPAGVRPIPLSGALGEAFDKYMRWYVGRFGEIQPDWYLFPGGHLSKSDPTKHVQTFDQSWQLLRKRARLEDRRFHDCRHTLITEMVERGVHPELIRQLVGHVSEKVIRKYSRVRREAKRAVLDDITAYREEMRAKNVIPISAKKPVAASAKKPAAKKRAASR